MNSLLSGIRVVEFAQYVMVPSAGALLADMGADVIKIEHPTQGDPYRGVKSFGLADTAAAESPSVAHTNRGKRGLGVDVKHRCGRALLDKLLGTADVFLTSIRAPALVRLSLDLEGVRAVNPNLIYARGSGFGVEGPDKDAPAFDLTAFWSRGGFANSLTPPDADYPVQMRPALGDRSSALALAMGVCAALFNRARTGQPGAVDVSLMGTACWILAGDILSALHGVTPGQERGRTTGPNPLTNTYRTRDGRWITLSALHSDRHWPELCRLLGREDLSDDPRYADWRARADNADACRAELDRAFASVDLAGWMDRLADFDGPWSPVQSAAEVVGDRQTAANGWIVELEGEDHPVYAVAGPARSDSDDGRLQRAPRVGEHTEEILLELGLTWNEIAGLKQRGAIT